MRELQAELSAADPCGNALQVRRLLGWAVIGGYILFETSQGEPRREAVAAPEYRAEPHWWNVSAKGVWVDLTPRTQHKDLVLVESPKTRVPPPSPEEAAMLRTPARHADVLTVDFVCGDVELKEVVLARKQLDSVRAPPPPRSVRCRDWRR